MISNILPKGKKFIFTIIDDTDDSFTYNIKPIYDLLYKNKLRTTKTVWVKKVRDIGISKGDSLENIEYRNFVKELKNKKFEIGLHNVGSGAFNRQEIKDGLLEFKNILGEYPSIHVNHSYNPDNIYSGSNRFSFPFSIFIKLFYSKYKKFYGDDTNSKYFWGDYHKKFIKYSRNYEIDDINVLKANPYMPYRDKAYENYANYWYSSTFAPNQLVFNKLINKKSIDRLKNEGGVCILYTHLGYFYKNGKIDKKFKETIELLGKDKEGLYITVSETLNLLKKYKKQNLIDDYIPFYHKKFLEFKSLITRIKYRFFVKIDDFHFKKTNKYNET
jgi:hypothetical protein